MLPPDEYAIRALDSTVQWLHDWGIDRNTTLRAVGVVTALTTTWDSFQTSSALWMSSILCALIVLLIIFLLWRQEHLSKSRHFNFMQLTHRDGTQAWMRCVLWAHLIGFTVAVDAESTVFLLIYVSFFYFTYTLKPIDDPKHHWSELFSKRSEAMT